MSPRRKSQVIWMLISAATGSLALPSLGQNGSASSAAIPTGTTPDDVVQAYLAENQLLEPLASMLRARLASASGEERPAAADRLGALYVKMLARATTPEQSRELEEHAKELLKSVPEAESFALRLDLAKATYQKAEDIAERERLKLATAEDRAEADRILRELGPALREIADRLSRRVETLERQDANARDLDSEVIRASLAEARSLRSLAKYYSGWCEYYTGWLTRDSSRGKAAMEQFGALLNAVKNRAATVDRMEPRMLRYEHVARAAVGCALTNSLLEEHNEASRWLDALERSDSLPKSVESQLFAYRVIVGARAGRWSDLEVSLKRRREPEPGGPVTPLSTVEARLLAVMTLESGDQPDLTSAGKASVERLAQAALAELVTKGEVQQVLDIVSRYGTAPIGKDGFVVTYVRGLQAFEKARTSLAQSADRVGAGKSGGRVKAATDSATINQFRAAASLLESAILSSDAKTFPNEQTGAMITRGLALLSAGDAEEAARQLEAAHAASVQEAQKRDALWYAIVALDDAIVAGKVSVRPNLDRLSQLFIQTYPGTDNATKLLLRQTNTGSMSDEQAIETLSKVSIDSPLWGAAQRQVVRLLYTSARSKPAGSEREFAIARFSQAADGLIRSLQMPASSETNAQGREAAEESILRARQLADVLLQSATPDVARVESALAMIEGLASFHGLDLTANASELSFRRLQVALIKNDDAAAGRELERLRSLGGPNSARAESLTFQHLAERWKQAPSDVGIARRLVGNGLRLLETNAASPNMMAFVRDTTAKAAFTIWRSNNDPASREIAMRDIALKVDRAMLESGVRTSAGLLRLAQTYEDSGDLPSSLGCWNELLLGVPASTDAWWEARYHSFRLASTVDPAQALVALEQHRVLHPEAPPQAWIVRMSQVEQLIKDKAASASTIPNPSITPSPTPPPPTTTPKVPSGG
jgi:hypothetical protein